MQNRSNPSGNELKYISIGHTNVNQTGKSPALGLIIQGGSNMTRTDLYVNKPHCSAAVRP